MQYLPIFVDAKQKRCLVVGGGDIAYRKANLLFKSGAQIDLIAPEVLDDLSDLVSKSGGEVFIREFVDSDIDNALLVIAATNDQSINKAVSEAAQVKNIPVNVVDDPALCTFVMGSIVDRSPITIAISSSGASPVLARMLRSRIESMIPSAYGELAKFMGGYRSKVKRLIPSEVARRRFWEGLLEGPVAEKVLAGKKAEADKLMGVVIDSTEDSLLGDVSLVGAGPGDPDLLTFKALRLLQSADVVLYDRLVSSAIVDLSRRDADKVYVGKARSNHAVPQEDINQLLVKYAREGKRVVRLKGGDPFIFGRGGEEIEGLAELNIPFQVIPGITAAAGCAAYSGIPLTHRDYAQSVKFVTGHLKDDSCNLNWESLIFTDQTVVFYMGLHGLPIISKKLIENGRAPETPVALVQKGTTPEQKVVIGDLSNINELVEKEKIKAPTLIIVGEVIELHDKLSWFGL
jgi:uroporphyrin-III C-methyltransferase/precorrin-2 dehydrogenase/sirohydrochlorin ferrochelatase